MKIIAFLIVLNFTGCSDSLNTFTTQSKCKNKIDIVYEKTKLDERLKGENYFLSLEQGFNDTLEIYLNGILIEKFFFKTDESLDLARSKMPYKISEDKINVLLIKSTKGHCLELLINKKFKILYVSFVEEEWWVAYSNRYKIYE